MWRKNDYKSCNIELDSEGENSDDDDDDDDDALDVDDDGVMSKRDIQYVRGDVTVPKKTDRDVNIIIHCAGNLLMWENFEKILTRQFYYSVLW